MKREIFVLIGSCLYIFMSALIVYFSFDMKDASRVTFALVGAMGIFGIIGVILRLNKNER